MAETSEELRQRVDRIDSKFYEDFDKRSAPFRDQGFEYEKLAIEYSHKGFQTLTYLNGGALVAIPTAMSFFKADVDRLDILVTAGAFIIGLLCVVVAEGCAFFTVAKRAEANDEFRWEQFHRVAALMYPHQTSVNMENLAKASQRHNSADKKIRHSNIWRWFGLAFFAGSLVSFVVGCGWGAKAVVAAKEKTEARDVTSSPAVSRPNP
jgi:hypothetical protein